MNNTKPWARHAACQAYLYKLRRETEARKRGWAYSLVNSLFSWRPNDDRRRQYRRDRETIERAVCEYVDRNSLSRNDLSACSLGELLLLIDGWRLRVPPLDPTGGGEHFEPEGGVAEIGLRAYFFESN